MKINSFNLNKIRNLHFDKRKINLIINQEVHGQVRSTISDLVTAKEHLETFLSIYQRGCIRISMGAGASKGCVSDIIR